MQEIRSSDPLAVTGICEPNKSRARHHHSLKLGSRMKYVKISHTFKTELPTKIVTNIYICTNILVYTPTYSKVDF